MNSEVEARLWRALQDVEDPEIPISVVGMGLIVSLAYRPEERAVDLELTFTAMGCPAMDFIEDDIRERLLQEPEVDDAVGEVDRDDQPHAHDGDRDLGVFDVAQRQPEARLDRLRLGQRGHPRYPFCSLAT